MRAFSIIHLRERGRDAFWLIPAGCVTAALALAVLLPRLDVHTTLLFPAGPESARSFLSSITSAMISVTGLVFSITIVALQLAAGQFSPRVMRDFLRDRIIQITFGVFVATFTYAMVLQRSVRGSSGAPGPFVPQVAVSVAFVFVLGSVGIFIVYINHIANAIRIANIIANIIARTRAVIERRYPRGGSAVAPLLPDRDADRVVCSRLAGVLVSVNEAELVACAAEADSIIAVLPRPGDFVPAGAPVLAIHGGGLDVRGLLDHVAFDTERTYEQDVAFGFRELVDIAERALSPAVNDPTTAAQAIDTLHDLLRRLATRPTPTGRHADATGRLRLVVAAYTFADMLDLAVEEIAHYGADDVQTPRRLRRMLADVISVALPAYRPALQARLDDLTARGGPSR